MDRLSASSDASAGACHNLDKIIMCFAAFNAVDQSSCIAKSAYRSRPYGNIIDPECCFLYTVICIKAFCSYSLECICRGILSFDKEVSTPESCLHNASRCSEDYAGSRSLPHRTVALSVYEGIRSYMGCTDHFYKLSCGYYYIYIPACIFLMEKLHLALAFFRDTRHNRNRKYLLRFHSELLCKIAFHYRTEHLLR